ncbi:L-histidine N(alpha)-methyltransferase, partial [Xanthomonas nasturtii]|uniref:L-histidine N(alpha)-methyltransferase n=1 Tax=Xanthomonas nasturtii TaxID=1843581 RepID=UPI0020139A09
NWQFQHAENAGDALQWMWFGGFSGATKYTDARFAELAAAAGLKVTHGWNDAKDWFGLRLLRPL